MQPGPRIFLSYRRDDSAFQTTTIHERLADAFGADRVFMDVDNIPLGRDFRTHMQQEIAKCDACLVVIGDRWLDACDGAGNRRLDNPLDFVRLELEAVLSRDIPVIPLLVGGAGVPGPGSLPKSLEALSYRHALSIRPGRDLKHDMQALIEQLHKMRRNSSPFISPTPATAPSPVPYDAPSSWPAAAGHQSGSHMSQPSLSALQSVTQRPQFFDTTRINIDRLMPGQVRGDNGLSLDLVWCPPGEFLMGSPHEDEGRGTNEDQVPVALTHGFWLGRFAVTQADFKRLMKVNPSHFSEGGEGKARVAGLETSRFPVERVSYADALEFCRILTGQERRANRLAREWEYTLPTEAQWEYACRAGTTTPFWFGSELNGRTANCDGSRPYGTDLKGPSVGQTTTVGSYGANPWGLHDMHGNVAEWCRDAYAVNLPGGTDPEVTADTTLRVFRGGSWKDSARGCRSAYRDWDAPSYRYYSLGFRVALSLVRN